MQHVDEDVESTIKHLVFAEPSSDMQARLVCSCRSRLYQRSAFAVGRLFASRPSGR